MYEGNRYFVVREQFTVYVRAGLKPSSVYVGGSQMLDFTYRPEILQPWKDEIHALVGGLFLVRDGEAFEIDIVPSVASLAPERQAPLPVHYLTQIGNPYSVRNYREHTPRLTGIVE